MGLEVALIAAGVAGVGSIIKAIGQKDGAEAAKAAAEKAIELYGPEAEQAILSEVPELSKVYAEPETVAAQKAALQRLQQIGTEGYTAEEKAAQARIQQEEAARAAGEQQQLRQQFAQRGVGGSGAELAAQMASTQGQANREAMRGLETAAQAQRRAFQAIQQQGQLAGSMRSSGFSEASTRAEAEDQRRRFNANQRAEQARDKARMRAGVPVTEGLGTQAWGGGLQAAGQTALGVYGAYDQDKKKAGSSGGLPAAGEGK